MLLWTFYVLFSSFYWHKPQTKWPSHAHTVEVKPLWTLKTGRTRSTDWSDLQTSRLKVGPTRFYPSWLSAELLLIPIFLFVAKFPPAACTAHADEEAAKTNRSRFCIRIPLLNDLFFFPHISGQIETIWAFQTQQSASGGKGEKKNENGLKQNTPPSNWTSETDEIKRRMTIWGWIFSLNCQTLGVHFVTASSPTRRGIKGGEMNQRREASSIVSVRVCVCVFRYYSHIAQVQPGTEA